jgi:hypothetical protein
MMMITVAFHNFVNAPKISPKVLKRKHQLVDTEKEGLTERMNLRNVKSVNMWKCFTYLLRMRHANKEQL